MKIRTMAPALVLCAVVAAGAQAQSARPFSIEVRGGASIPTGSFGQGLPVSQGGGCCLSNSTGWNLSGTVMFAATPSFSVYAGYQHDQFSVDNDAGDVDWGVEDNGVRAGARLSLPLPTLPAIRPFAEGGVIYNRAAPTGGHPLTPVESAWKTGFEAGAGLAVDLTPHVSLTPGVRYRKHNAGGDLTYVAVDMGLELRP